MLVAIVEGLAQCFVAEGKGHAAFVLQMVAIAEGLVQCFVAARTGKLEVFVVQEKRSLAAVPAPAAAAVGLLAYYPAS